jgi:hypothetical protein
MNSTARIAFSSRIIALAAAAIVLTWPAPESAPPVHQHAVGLTRPMSMSTSMSMPMPMEETGMPHGVSPPEHGPPLSAGTEHGLAHRLSQYPAIFLATAKQRAAAEQLRQQLFTAAQQWANPRSAAAAGFDLRRTRRAPGQVRVMWFHSENRRWHAARDASLDPSHPDTLIYADLPGRPLKLVGVMISIPRGLRGPTPGGPITRWHDHLVCVAGNMRGLAPRPDGSCPAGSKLGVGSEMMHVWFTRDLRSAYAIHAPWPEICAAHLLPAATCASGERFTGM